MLYLISFNLFSYKNDDTVTTIIKNSSCSSLISEERERNTIYNQSEIFTYDTYTAFAKSLNYGECICYYFINLECEMDHYQRLIYKAVTHPYLEEIYVIQLLERLFSHLLNYTNQKIIRVISVHNLISDKIVCTIHEYYIH